MKRSLFHLIFWAMMFTVSICWVGTSFAVPMGPVFPAPGGTTFVAGGQPSAGDAGGRDFNYSNFDSSQFSDLWWGPNSSFLPSAGLNGTANQFTSFSISGTTATWTGTTAWTAGGVFTDTIPWELRIQVTGLGANPWVTSASVPGLDPGAGTGIGAVVNNASGLDFSANLQFLANTGGGFQAMNDITPQFTGRTRTSVGTAFYYEPAAVPIPSTLFIFGLGFAGFATWRYRAEKLEKS